VCRQLQKQRELLPEPELLPVLPPEREPELLLRVLLPPELHLRRAPQQQHHTVYY
jgi:hypothetical protein